MALDEEHSATWRRGRKEQDEKSEAEVEGEMEEARIAPELRPTDARA